MKVLEASYDIVIAGGGGAALTCAAAATDLGLRVLVLSKDPLAGGDTKISEGGICVRGCGDPEDTVASFVSNLKIKGDDLADDDIVRAFANDSQHAYAWLRKEGIRPFIRESDGGLRTYPMPLGGHNTVRSIPHANGGLAFAHALSGSWRSRKYDALGDAWMLEVLCGGPVESRHVTGALIYLPVKGELVSVRASAVVLATGGLGSLYFPNTDNTRSNTADGHAMALRAGAMLVDMEQIQFIPFAMARPRAFRGIFVGEPAAAGPLGVLRDGHGRILMSGLMHRTRAEIAAVMAVAVRKGRGTPSGGCFLDLSENARGRSGSLFRQLYSQQNHRCLEVVARAQGREAAAFKAPWEVVPSAHYCMGGVCVDENGAVSGNGALHGLFAIGQVAGGLHGSNRLGSTSLSEILVFGLRAAAAAVKQLDTSAGRDLSGFRSEADAVALGYERMMGRKGVVAPETLIRRLSACAWEKIGPARDADGLHGFLREISGIRKESSLTNIGGDPVWNQSFMDQVELENMLLAAESIARSALARKSSLGAHYRLDSRSGSWAFSQGVAFSNGQWRMSRLKRVVSPFYERCRDKITDGAKRMQIHLLRMLPENLQDRVLVSKYSRWME